MEPALARCLTLLVITVLAALAIFAATELTARAEITRPLRDRLLLAWIQLDRQGPDWVAKIVGFFAAAWTCPFCTSFWHGAWIAPFLCLVTGAGWPIGIALYFPAIGLSKVLLDRSGRDRQPAPNQNGAAGLIQRVSR